MANTKKTTETAPKTVKDSKEQKAPKEVKEQKVAKKETKAHKESKKETKVAAKEAAPAVESAPESAEAPASDVPATAAKLAEFGAKIQALSAFISALKVEHKALEKSYQRDIKAAQKGSFRRKRSSGNRQPSGFVKPTRISDELAVFLGKDKGTEMARTAVSKEINEYIKKHNLQDSKNGRMINPDAPLSKLLGVKGEELTYFNLQKFLKHHFVKSEAPSATA